MTTIQELVRKMEQDYISGSPTTKSKYVTFDQYENINTIDAYFNSKHITGSTDSQGRDKPFFNIVIAAVNIWTRATDIDRKNIKIKANKSSNYLAAFFATLKLQDWMKRNNFGKFLNEWGRTLAKYGSAVVKFIEKDGELYKSVISWHSLICDSVDFDNNPKIEKLYFTPAQLRMNGSYDQEVVEKLIDAVEKRQTLDKRDVDSKTDFITLYEIHGNLPLSLLTGKETDEKKYRQQMQVVSFVEGKEKGKYDDFTLFKGKEAKDPYMITHLLEEDGRTQAVGAVEYLFEAQWMQNHTVKAIKDQLDLASKLIFQTADGNYVGRNALTDIENGNILVHAEHRPLTQIANTSHDISSLQNFASQWKVLAQELTSTPDAIMGKSAPSGTAWRQVEALQQEANSLFELMVENKGLHIEDMLTTYILPFFKKTLNNKDELAAILEDHQITQIDSIWIPHEVNERTNRKYVADVLNGATPLPEEIALEKDKNQQQITTDISKLGNQRFFAPDKIGSKTWAKIFKDLEWNVDVDITGENKDSQNVMATLTTVLQTIASNPMILQDPNARMVFNKIITETGALSPIELTATKSQVQAQPNPADMVGGNAGQGNEQMGGMGKGMVNKMIGK